ncbi:MAG: hypothetical protein ACLRQ0_09865 [Monoglobales bacterium]
MATFKYSHAVKANGKIIPPNTPVEVEEEKSETAETTTETTKTMVKRRTTKKKV